MNVRRAAGLWLAVLAAALIGCDQGEKPARPKPTTQPAKAARPTTRKATAPSTQSTPSTKPAEPTVRFEGKTWRVLQKFYFDAPGKVYVEKDKLVLEPGEELTGVVWDKANGEFPDCEYEVTLEAARIKGDDFLCGMTFTAREKEHATLILGGWGGSAVGISNIDGMSAIENETTQSVDFKAGKWYDVKLRVAGGYIRVWLDGKKLIEVKTKGRKFEVWPQMEPCRPFGLATYVTKGAYRNIKIRDLLAEGEGKK